MKLLFFYPYIPYPPNRGAYHRTYHFAREMSRYHEVDLLALAENCDGMEHAGVFEKFCGRVEAIPFQHPPWARLMPDRLMNPLPATIAHWTLPQVAPALDKMVASGDYDAVHVCDIVLAQYFLEAGRPWPLVTDRTRVDLQYQWMEHRRMRHSLRSRVLNFENFLKLWRYERLIAKRVAFQVVCGPDDEAFLRKHVSRDMRIAVVPNGVDLDYFHPFAAPDETRSVQPTILFCGAMDYNPNVDALRWYFSEIHKALRRKIPGLQVLIVGKDPVKEVQSYAEKANVTVTGGVPDVRPYYRRAWLQIVPLRIGGGTRLKIVESMAMSTAVVSTRIGAQGLDLRHDHDILLADSAENFIRQTARALKEIDLRESVERNGLETARSRLSWPMLGKRLSEHYERGISAVSLGAAVSGGTAGR
jgi:polysaccharide biosynthesis protein PslH